MSEMYATVIGVAIGFGIAGIMAMNGAWYTEPEQPVYTVNTIDITEYIDFQDAAKVECIIITGGDFAMAGPCVTSY